MSLLFNLPEVKELLRNFYTLTGIRTVIFDNSFTELAAYPTRHSTYCHIIRSDPRAEAQCILCDQAACTQVKRRKPSTPINVMPDLPKRWFLFKRTIRSSDILCSANCCRPGPVMSYGKRSVRI